MQYKHPVLNIWYFLVVNPGVYNAEGVICKLSELTEQLYVITHIIYVFLQSNQNLKKTVAIDNPMKKSIIIL